GPHRRGDDSLGVDPSDDVLSGVRDVQVAVSIEHQRAGRREAGLRRPASIAGGAGAAIAHDRGDDASLIYSSDATVSGVGNVEILLRIQGEPRRLVEKCLRGRLAVAAEAA